MVAEIIAVGTEIILGNIVNTNAAYLATQLANLGFHAQYQVAVGDNSKVLKEAIIAAKKRADIILLTGGLGPTQDDLTKEVVAEVFQREMFLDQDSKQRLEQFFAIRNIPLTDNNWKQAYIPEGARAVTNNNGTAPGIILEEEGQSVILLPGPPNELVPMFEESIGPYLQTLSNEIIYSHTIKLCGIGESLVETKVLDLIKNQTNPTIATYAKIGQVDIRITAKAENELKAKQLVQPMVHCVKERFDQFIYSENEKESLEQSLMTLLNTRNLTLAVAESCTGGLLGGSLVNVSGASAIFKAGFIVYANEAKENILKISHQTLEQFGAVSKETAEEMVNQATLLANADCAISITGIAGPDGGSIEKPVGLVYIGCKCNGKTKIHKCNFSGNRDKIRNSAVIYGMIYLRQLCLEEN